MEARLITYMDADMQVAIYENGKLLSSGSYDEMGRQQAYSQVGFSVSYHEVDGQWFSERGGSWPFNESEVKINF